MTIGANIFGRDGLHALIGNTLIFSGTLSNAERNSISSFESRDSLLNYICTHRHNNNQ
ncbi:MAG: hypothetical protein P4L27_13960 [Ignavibacteriaceae bacterium]|nr:hypothetical protein [Ignavibacteriaceae bacterium]